MEWIQLVTGIGIGAIVVKLLDIFWLQDVLQRHQRDSWLRDKRLEAFSEVTKELITFGMHEDMPRSTFKSYGTISRALLLLDDDRTVRRIDRFIVDMDRLFRITDSSESVNKETENLYHSLESEAREITLLLRGVILRDHPATPFQFARYMGELLKGHWKR